MDSTLGDPSGPVNTGDAEYRGALDPAGASGAGRGEGEIGALLGRWGVSRQIYVAETDAQALAEARAAEEWYQESFRRFVIPDRIEDAHPSLQPGFRAMAERLSAVTWENLVRETLAFGSPDTVARHIEEMRAIVADPERHRAFLLRSSLIASVRKAASIT